MFMTLRNDVYFYMTDEWTAENKANVNYRVYRFYRVYDPEIH